MLHIDHIALGVQNLYEGAERLRSETGFGDEEGGWFPGIGVANRIMPLGADQYLEVESVIDAFSGPRMAAGRWFLDQLALGDVFLGWCARADTRAEIDAVASAHGCAVAESGGRVRLDGTRSSSNHAPPTLTAWQRGLPNVFCWPDMSEHPGRVEVRSQVETRGVAWLEVGGTEADMRAWLGDGVRGLPLRYNGRAHGLYAVAVGTEHGEQVIRRRSILHG